MIFIPASAAPGYIPIAYTYEYVNKNISSYDGAFTYTGNKLTSILYTVGGGLFITKTLSYTGNKLTSVVLSGDTPLGIVLPAERELRSTVTLFPFSMLRVNRLPLKTAEVRFWSSLPPAPRHHLHHHVHSIRTT